MSHYEERLEQDEESLFFDSHPTMKTRIHLMRDYADVEQNNSRAASQLLPDVEALQERLHHQLFGT